MVLLLLACPGCSSTNGAVPEAPFKAIEHDVLRLVNTHRKSLDLLPLEYNSHISFVAREHSIEMAQDRIPFGHYRFKQRLHRISRVVGFSVAGENVAFNQGVDDPALDALQGWLDSPGHRRNIEGEYNLTGIGVHQDENGVLFYTQIFARSY